MLVREDYIRCIKERLGWLCSHIKLENGNLRYDVNHGAETFYANLLNIIYDYELINGNDFEKNMTALDLIDKQNRLAVQVTSDTSPTKVKETLKKFKEMDYAKIYERIIIFVITESIPHERAYKNLPDVGVPFDPNNDIWDCNTIVKDLSETKFPIKRLEEIAKFLEENIRDSYNKSGNFILGSKVYIDCPYPNYNENYYPFEFYNEQVYPRVPWYDWVKLKDGATSCHLAVSINNLCASDIAVREFRIHILNYQQVSPQHCAYDNRWGSCGSEYGHVYCCDLPAQEAAFNLQFCGDQDLNEIYKGNVHTDRKYAHISIEPGKYDYMHVVMNCKKSGLYTLQFELIYDVGGIENNCVTGKRTWYFPDVEENDVDNKVTIFRTEHREGVYYETLITDNILDILAGKQQLSREMINILKRCIT